MTQEVREYPLEYRIGIADATQLTDSPARFSDQIEVTNNASATITECDMCLIKSLRIQASAPFYDGKTIAEQKLYESLTAQCGVADMPRTTLSLPYSQ